MKKHGEDVTNALIRVHTNRFKPNRFCVLKPNPTSRASRVNSDPTACRELEANVAEWIKRLATRFHSRGLLRLDREDWVAFTACLETKDVNNRPVPPHYHVAIAVPDQHLAWFDGLRGGRHLWGQITGSPNADTYHSRDPRNESDRDAAVNYDCKSLTEAENWNYLLFPARLRDFWKNKPVR